MNLPRDQLLPSATLPTNQYGRRRGPHLPDDRENLEHRGRLSYQIPEYATKAQVALELIRFLQTPFVANRAFQKSPEGERLHGLFQEPKCLEVMHRGQRLLHAAEAGECDRWSEVAAFLQIPEQFEAVHARHDQVRDNDVRIEGSELLERFAPIRGDLRVKLRLGKHARQSSALALVIVDYEDPARNRGQCGHESL